MRSKKVAALAVTTGVLGAVTLGIGSGTAAADPWGPGPGYSCGYGPGPQCFQPQSQPFPVFLAEVRVIPPPPPWAPYAGPPPIPPGFQPAINPGGVPVWVSCAPGPGLNLQWRSQWDAIWSV